MVINIREVTAFTSFDPNKKVSRVTRKCIIYIESLIISFPTNWTRSKSSKSNIFEHNFQHSTAFMSEVCIWTFYII